MQAMFPHKESYIKQAAAFRFIMMRRNCFFLELNLKMCPTTPMTACLDECDHRHNLQTNKRLMATVVVLLADLIKEAFCVSSSAQRMLMMELMAVAFFTSITSSEE